MDAVTLILVIVGAVGPLVVAAAVIFFGARGSRGNPGIALATVKGIVIGAVAGLLVCAVVIGGVLMLRALFRR